MEHLSAEQLVDVLEGGEAPAHLAACDSCRKRLEDLRALTAEAAGVEMPEPSPVFWQQFSERIREATDRKGSGPGAWTPRWLFGGAWWGLPLAAGAVAAVVVAVAVGVRGMRPAPVDSAVAAMTTAATAPADPDVAGTQTAGNDSSLAFVADLASGLDWDGFSQAGLTPPVGGVDDALGQLTDNERAALRELLAEEMGRPGA
jgi:hypothetical protein